MKNTNPTTIIKGNYIKKRNQYIFKDNHIMCKRNGSIVEIKNNIVIIHTDITGIDKIYFKIIDNKIIISNIFKDFLNNKLNEEFVEFQKIKGYIPYPFTILKNVMKAPPGLITEFYVDTQGKIKYTYRKSEDLKIFNINNNFNKDEFRDKFTELLIKNAKDQNTLISSFSGGFDSLLLTQIYSKKCQHIIHFIENKKINISYFKSILPNVNWTIIDNYEKFSETDLIKYFKSIDEPCCDHVGFSEYLMIKAASKEFAIKKHPIINGQGADGLFANGRIYFQHQIAHKLKCPLSIIKKPQNTETKNALYRLSNYFINTKDRFFRYYFTNHNLSAESYAEFEKIYKIYDKEINNDPANKLAALILILYYSLHGIEKIKTTSRLFNIKYYLPFMSQNIIQYAFSIPSKYKVGAKRGKKILVNSYGEIKKMKFVSAGFSTPILKDRLIKNKFGKNTKYEEYYFNNWIKMQYFSSTKK